jgi:hypothetical protein
VGDSTDLGCGCACASDNFNCTSSEEVRKEKRTRGMNLSTERLDELNTDPVLRQLGLNWARSHLYYRKLGSTVVDPEKDNLAKTIIKMVEEERGV